MQRLVQDCSSSSLPSPILSCILRVVCITFSASFMFTLGYKCTNVTIAWCGYQLTKTVQNGGPHAISEILHIEYQIVCCIETYHTHLSYEQV